MDHVPGDFFHRMKAFAQAWNTISIPATTLSIASIAVMIFCLKYAKRIPGAIVVTFGATAAVLLLRLPVETIGTRFGGIPSGLPTIAVPKLQYDVVRQLLSPAFTVAVLGAIESLMSAAVSDRMSNDKHNPNVELVAQGVANIMSPLFGGLPRTPPRSGKHLCEYQRCIGTRGSTLRGAAHWREPRSREDGELEVTVPAVLSVTEKFSCGTFARNNPPFERTLILLLWPRDAAFAAP
jgi:Sulfate permease family